MQATPELVDHVWLHPSPFVTAAQSHFVLTWSQEHCPPSCGKTLDPEQTDASSRIQLLVGCADVLGLSLLGDCFLMKSACLMSSLLNSTVRSPLTHFYPTESQTPHIHSDARPSYTSKHLPKDRPMQILWTRKLLTVAILGLLYDLWALGVIA